LRFAFVMPYYMPDGIGGGAERQAHLLAHALAERGHEVFYLAGNPKGKPQFEEDAGVSVMRVLRHPAKLHFLDYPRILSHLRRLSPDVVLSRIRMYYFPVSLYGLLPRRTSVIFIPEDRLSTPFPETRMIWRGVGLTPKMPLYIAHALATDVFAQTGLMLADRLVVQNEIQRRNVRKFFLRRAVKLPSLFRPPRVVASKSPKPLILWVGNVRATKRPEVFVDVAARLPEYDFVMVGRKTERFSGALPNLRALGELPHDDVLRWMARAWVLINTSTARGEGFPNVFLEAWYLRTAVVSFGADPDGLVSSGLGLKVEDADEGAAAVRRIVEDAEFRSRLTERAHTHVLENHLPEVVVPKFLRIVSGINGG